MRESIILNKYEVVSSHVMNLKIGGGQELSLHPVYTFVQALVEATAATTHDPQRSE
jgi:hypothetical protein